MHITFFIQYASAPGQRLQVVLGTTAHDLAWSEGNWWRAELEATPIGHYHYRVVTDTGVATEERHPSREIPGGDTATTVVDRWRPHDSARLSRQSAFFQNAIAARHDSPGPDSSGSVTFRLLEPGIPPFTRPAVVGAAPALGAWDPDEAVALSPAPFPWWEASVDLDGATEYKYVLVHDDPAPGEAPTWESGQNRVVPEHPSGPTVVNDDGINGLPGWRGAGVAVPVFSLRSATDIGVGQFTDLMPLADWAAEVGLSLIQLLPVNDTVLNHDWDDSYPYNPVSVQALHPLYLDITAIEGASIDTMIQDARAEVNDLPGVDYVRVMELKWNLLRRAYRNLKGTLDNDTSFEGFVDGAWDWLGPYSLWCTLRDRHGTPDFNHWGTDATFDPARLEAAATLDSAEYDDLRFHWFVQYHLQRQLNISADYARARGVALKGDLPIGVAPESVEVWTRPELFHIGAQTGAPPDAFAVRGQNWEFPTYNWGEMAEDGYRWWRDRFTALAGYVDAYRIDHVLGFFRIWEIPHESDDGLLGRFRPSIPLTADEITRALGPVDLEPLLEPTTTAADLDERLGANAALVRERYCSGPDDDIRLKPGVRTQRSILDLFRKGLLLDLDGADRAAVERAMLDIAADVLLLRVDDGYQPRISWEHTLHYQRLDADQRARFDAMAIDFFHHRHAKLWEQQGRTTLPAVVAATDMLACGEDLGMVPEQVPRLMNEMGLLSLEIERMPKRLGAWIADPAEAPYLSVVSPSTHDTTTLRMWWEQERDIAQRFWEDAMGRDGDAPETLSADIAELIVRRQLVSPAMLCVIPLSDLMAIDDQLRLSDPGAERINDPSNRHNRWTFRMHVSLEDLRGARTFNAWTRGLIAQSNR